MEEGGGGHPLKIFQIAKKRATPFSVPYGPSFAHLLVKNDQVMSGHRAMTSQREQPLAGFGRNSRLFNIERWYRAEGRFVELRSGEFDLTLSHWLSSFWRSFKIKVRPMTLVDIRWCYALFMSNKNLWGAEINSSIHFRHWRFIFTAAQATIDLKFPVTGQLQLAGGWRKATLCALCQQLLLICFQLPNMSSADKCVSYH